MASYPSTLLLSSKHHKDQLLAPLFAEFGHNLIENKGFDTDQFGTFCGTTPRKEGPKVCLKEKCVAGLAFAGKKQGLASEGSFGPHPSFPLLSLNEEWLLYLDLENDIEIYGQSTTMETCFAQLTFKQKAQLEIFLSTCNFGSQGLVFKDLQNEKIIVKGIQEQDHLADLIKTYPYWQIETDLRAHMNPTRQKNIASAAQDLLQRMYRFCPKCAAPDFSISKRYGHLPCDMCSRPTNSYLFTVHQCKNCSYQEEEIRQDRQVEDPQFCNYCNP